MKSNLKLPKLELKKFSGELALWNTFWDSFEAAIHNNQSLSPIDKFNYLQSLLTGNAYYSISGLSLTAVNYDEAIAILKRRFGNRQLIINRQMELMMNVRSVNSDKDISGLRQLYDTVESNVRGLKAIGVHPGSYGSILAPILMEKLSPDLKIIISRQVGDSSWELDNLLESLGSELDARERINGGATIQHNTSQVPNTNARSATFSNRSQPTRPYPTVTALMSNTGVTHCTYCKDTHRTNACHNVTNIAARKNILRRERRCFICLRKGHFSSDCHPEKRCLRCKERHHISLCPPPGNSEPRSDQRHRGSSSTDSSHYSPTNNHPVARATNLYVSSSVPVILQTARCNIFSHRNNTYKLNARLIFDNGSQRSYVTEAVSKYLELPKIDEKMIIIKTFGSNVERQQVVDVVSLCVQTNIGVVELTFFVVPFICDPLRNQPIQDAKRSFPNIPYYEFADYAENEDEVQIDLLIGSDQYWNLVNGGLIKGENNLTALDTKLGWVLSGPVKCGISQSTQHSHYVTTHVLRSDTSIEDESYEYIHEKTNLEASLHKFWDLESIGIQPKSTYDELVDKIDFKDGRYEVSLPWKIPHPVLPDNYVLSQKRLENLLRRLRHQPEVFQEYDNIIRNQLERGILERVDEPQMSGIGRTHYIPHHAVVRRDKATTKLRIVYDASARSKGPSLNDCLLAGPPLTHNILDILLRFRIHKIALTGDIEQAFLMVGIPEEERDVLRFLWVHDINEDEFQEMVLRFARVPFGVTSSPFMLNATIKFHIEQYLETDKDFVKKLLASIYVDDLSCGSDSVQEAYEFYSKAKSRLLSGGFNLRKFCSNSPELRQLIAASEKVPESPKQANEPHSLTNEDATFAEINVGGLDYTNNEFEQKILGIRWNYDQDLFTFDLEVLYKLAKDCLPTKRNIVSLASKIFDPMGYISPVTIQFKLIFQELCKLGIDWDEPIRGSILDNWETLIRTLSVKCVFCLPRCVFSDISGKILNCSLHGFCDASIKAYGAVIYLRVHTTEGIYSRYIVSKTRVAPIAKFTIPRFELLSALVLARLLASVEGALSNEININDTFCWTDSKVAMYWITQEHREWKQFVQNRVSEIRTLISASSFRHCKGKTNPADILSRGMSPFDLVTNLLWKEGPSWLFQNQNFDKSCDEGNFFVPECLDEMKVRDKENFVKCDLGTISLLTPSKVPIIISQIVQCENFSNVQRLFRVTAYVLKSIDVFKHKRGDGQHLLPLSKYIQKAENLWLLDNQLNLHYNKNFSKWKREFQFFTDNNGLIRCNGRLANAEIQESTKHPVILDTSHHLTTLLVREAHHRVYHGGVKATLTQLRSKYWIVRGRQLVRKFIHKCVTCRRLEAKPYPPRQTPPLPWYRVQESPPFSYTGVDFAGPLYIKTNHPGESDKVWIVLFTCCVTRAVHLDLVRDMSSLTFIRCFKRFSARYGVPVMVISDNAKTFKSAAKELKSVISNVTIKDYFVKERIQWTFNLEKAPWWGGIFERLIKSAKRCLRKILGVAKLCYDELLTIVCEIANVLNCRPLSYVSSDDIEEPLTPSHLIYGRRLLSVVDVQPNLELSDLELADSSAMSKRLGYMNNIMCHFWNRWKQEYLVELRNSHRNVHKVKPGDTQIKIGDVVVVNDENKRRNFWKLGKIELISGKDNIVRGALVRVTSKTGTITLRRPIQLLYPLEINCHVKPDDGLPVDVDLNPDEELPVDVRPDEDLQIRPRRAAAIASDIKRRKWIKQLSN